MKRKIAMLVSGVFTAAAVWGSSALAMTYGYDQGGKTIYITESQEAAKNEICWAEGTAAEYSLAGDLSEEEKRKLSDWHKEEMRQSIAYLERYGVFYDAENDQIVYQEKNVRCLIDQQFDDTYKEIQMPEGEVDLYTIREADYSLTGVRIATQEEYDQRTKELAANKAAAEAIYNAEEGTNTIVMEEAHDSEAYGNLYEDNGKKQEYGQYGIEYGRNGSWMWQGKPVYLLMDEDGGFYQNGSREAKDNKIYLIVKRSNDRRIKEVRQVTVEEAMAERIIWEN